MPTLCRKCGASIEPADFKFCPACGTPTAKEFLVKHEDAVDQFGHHEAVLQNYRAMFLVTETFSVSVAATRVDNRGLVVLLAAFGISWLVVWVIVTTLRERVVDFFEKRDEDGALMRFHRDVEGVAHRVGFWVFTIMFPAMFAVFWMSLILLAYGVLRIG